MRRLLFQQKRKRSSVPNLVIKPQSHWKKAVFIPAGLFVVGVVLGFVGDRFALHRSYERFNVDEIKQMQSDLQDFQAKNARLSSELGTAQTSLNSERAAKEDFMKQLQLLNNEKKELLEKLKFFEVLLPISEDKSLVQIRSAELTQKEGAIQYTILLMRPQAAEHLFKGKIQFIAKGAKPSESVELKPFVIANGTSDAAASSDTLAISFQQYQRVEGLLRMPVTNFAVKNITVRVLEDNKVRGQYDVQWTQ